MTDAVKAVLKGRIPADREGLVFLQRHDKTQITHISATFHLVVKELGFNNGIEISDNGYHFTVYGILMLHGWLYQVKVFL